VFFRGGIVKILIAYDGSECADAALEDLKTAGLPKTAEALVLTSLPEVRRIASANTMNLINPKS
jgi:hypothetical protein